MLQFRVKPVDLAWISKLLVKSNVKASITDSVITLEGDVSDEAFMELCKGMEILNVQNFISEELLKLPAEIVTVKSEAPIQSVTETQPDNECDDEITQIEMPLEDADYELLYPKVKRGELYWCDFGQPYGSEQGFMRYAIVLQNDEGNTASPTTIVIPCTTEMKKKMPVHLSCVFSVANMSDYDVRRVGTKTNVIMTEQIQTVDKRRLRRYLGRLKPEFMKQIENKVLISLHLEEAKKAAAKQTKAVVQRINKDGIGQETQQPKERRDLNVEQIRLLSFVDSAKLFEISNSSAADEVKAQKILELFGFDFNRNGVQYLYRAIIASPKNDYFNLETLSEKVSENESIDKEEVKRLIVARVKERFGFRKAPTTDFIRLVNIFLTKQEDSYEEANI